MKLKKIADSYQACSIIEQFCDYDLCNDHNYLLSVAYIQKNELYKQLQGFYGRLCKDFIDSGYIDNKGNILINLEND